MILITKKKKDKRTKRKIVHSLLGRQMKKNVLLTVTSMRQRKVTEEIQELRKFQRAEPFGICSPVLYHGASERSLVG